VSVDATMKFPAWEIVMQIKPDYEMPRRWVLSPEATKSKH
jgi:hypothetical protein